MGGGKIPKSAQKLTQERKKYPAGPAETLTPNLSLMSSVLYH